MNNNVIFTPLAIMVFHWLGCLSVVYPHFIYFIVYCFFVFLFFLCSFLVKKRFIIHRDLVSMVNNIVGYNLPDSYLGIPLSIFTINIILGNKNIKNYTIKCYVYIIVDHTQFKYFKLI